MARHSLRITEHRHMVVNQVQARNESRRPVLLLAGEEIIGARQNRVINTSVWVEPGQAVELPVSCVEEKRHTGRNEFRSGEIMYFTSARQAHARDVTQSYRAGRGATANQQRVWSDVRTRLQQSGTRTATQSMHAMYEQPQVDVLERASTLRGGAGECGFAFLMGDRLLALELFGSAAFCAQVYPKYLRSQLLDTTPGAAQAVDVERLLRQLLERELEAFPSAGSGLDARFSFRGCHGSALVLPDSSRRCGPGPGLAHLSLYPN
jgi:hypothetical protein